MHAVFCVFFCKLPSDCTLVVFPFEQFVFCAVCIILQKLQFSIHACVVFAFFLLTSRQQWLFSRYKVKFQTKFQHT